MLKTLKRMRKRLTAPSNYYARFYEYNLLASTKKGRMKLQYLDWMNSIHQRNLKVEDAALSNKDEVKNILKDLIEFNYMLGVDVFVLYKNSSRSIYFSS